MSDPHVDDKNTCGASMIGTIIHIIDHGTILETYPASPKTCWRFRILPIPPRFRMVAAVHEKERVYTEAFLVTRYDKHFSYAEARGPKATTQVT